MPVLKTVIWEPGLVRKKRKAHLLSGGRPHSAGASDLVWRAAGSGEGRGELSQEGNIGYLGYKDQR